MRHAVAATMLYGEGLIQLATATQQVGQALQTVGDNVGHQAALAIVTPPSDHRGWPMTNLGEHGSDGTQRASLVAGHPTEEAASGRMDQPGHLE